MNDTLTLEHIAPYLPNDLTVITKEGFADRLVGLEINPVGNLILKAIAVGDGEYQYNLDVDGVKLSLLPLSALVEPLEDATVPIVELAKKFHINKRYNVTHYQNPRIYPNRQCIVNCCVENDDSRYMYFYVDLQNIQKERHDVVQYLFKHHFDVFGLIEKGLAIDKRTLK